jgi:hypothetical protein
MVRCVSSQVTWTHGMVREYLGYETHGTDREDLMQLGTIVARTRGPLTAVRTRHGKYCTIT